MKKICIVYAVISFFLLGNFAHALDALSLVKKSEEILRGRSSAVIYEMTIKTRRWTRVLGFKAWEERKSKRSFSEITSPKKDAGNRFLLIDKEMRQYIPNLQKDIKISPSMMLQNWMGSDFTNDDIIKESSIIQDYTHKIIKELKVDGFNCYQIELTPKENAPVVWGKILLYLRVDDSLPVKKEYYDENGDLTKIMTFSEFKKMDDRIIPTVYKMKTVGEKDKHTILVIKKVKYNIKIPSKVFTIQYLKRK